MTARYTASDSSLIDGCAGFVFHRTRGLIVIILADLFGGFILPFLNLPLFSKPKVADFFFEI
jgi:hypothetical protein